MSPQSNSANGTAGMEQWHLQDGCLTCSSEASGPRPACQGCGPQAGVLGRHCSSPQCQEGVSTCSLLLPPCVNLLRSRQHRLVQLGLNDPYQLLSPLLANLALGPAMPFNQSINFVSLGPNRGPTDSQTIQ